MEIDGQTDRRSLRKDVSYRNDPVSYNVNKMRKYDKGKTKFAIYSLELAIFF